jgi:uncharacterized membrane protein YgdD (TMEM256/DUF423 family)
MPDDTKDVTQVGSPRIASLGALIAFAGVLLGSLGAHGLKPRFDDVHLRIFETAVRYQLWHAIALVSIGVTPAATARGMNVAFALFLVGIALFSGTLYGFALGGPIWLGLLTPIGGLSFMAGWLMVAFAVRPRA